MTADLTRGLLQRAIKEIVAYFPVYRTYVDLAGTPDRSGPPRPRLGDIAGPPDRSRRPRRPPSISSRAR